MDSALTDRELLARSLGVLSEGEATRIDECLFTDFGARERAKAIECFFSDRTDVVVGEDWQKIVSHLDDESEKQSVSVLRTSVCRASRRWRGFIAGAIVAAGLAIVIMLHFSTDVARWRDADGRAIANGSELSASLLVPKVVEFGNKARFSLAPGSTASLKQIPFEGGLPSGELNLLSGRVDVDLECKVFARFDVTVGQTLVRVIGTKFSVSQLVGEIQIAVSRGQVNVSYNGGVVYSVLAGGTATVAPDGTILVRQMTSEKATTEAVVQNETIILSKSLETNESGASAANMGTIQASVKKAEQECITLKDGTVLHGKIIQMDDLILRIETAFGTYDIKQSQIRKVQYK